MKPHQFEPSFRNSFALRNLPDNVSRETQGKS